MKKASSFGVILLVLILLIIVIIGLVISNPVSGESQTGVPEIASYPTGNSLGVQSYKTYEKSQDSIYCTDEPKEVSCFNGVDQIGGEGPCIFVDQSNKRCYKKVISGCNEKLVEVSCMDELEQVKNEGPCLYVEQNKKSCYTQDKVGCNTVLREVSCYDEIDQIEGEGPCEYIDQSTKVCYR